MLYPSSVKDVPVLDVINSQNILFRKADVQKTFRILFLISVATLQPLGFGRILPKSLSTRRAPSTERSRRYRDRVKQDPSRYQQYVEKQKQYTGRYREKKKLLKKQMSFLGSRNDYMQ